MSLEEQVAQFNEKYEIEVSPIPRLPTEEEATLMHNLILEELLELNEAIDSKDLTETFDAICDILYVTAQQAHRLGLPITEGLREVQRSNLSKLGADGKPVKREDGKVIKGPLYSPPDLESILVGYMK